MKMEIINKIKMVHPAISSVRYLPNELSITLHRLIKGKHDLIPLRVLHKVSDFLKKENLSRSNLAIQVEASEYSPTLTTNS